ncbi:MAG: hypothetical protein LBH43_08960 [Treponema sp.]|nr:hypothetical protein [Treponema sp.]
MPFTACGSRPRAVGEGVRLPAPKEPSSAGPSGGAEEIRSLMLGGSPSSLRSSLELISSLELGNTEFGRVMNAAAVAVLRIVYPSFPVKLPSSDPLQAHVYARILRNVELGVYVSPPAGSQDYLELVLPFLALYNEVQKEKLLEALPYILKGEALNPNAVLAPLFLGIIYERIGMAKDAEDSYSRAWNLSAELSESSYPDCYPAALSLARIMESRGQGREAAALLSELAIRFPDNLQVKRQLAYVYYRNQDWSRAEPAIAEILQRDSRDGEFILMRSHTLVEQGQWQQAQSSLDIYAQANQNNRLYFFLRARVQAEGYHNRDSALNYLRSLIRVPQGTVIDDEASTYAIRLLMESPRIEDQNEGRELLKGFLANPNPSYALLSLGLQDCIRRRAWVEARTYLSRLLAGRRSFQDLLDAYTVEHSQGYNAAALSYARELYEKDRSNDDGICVYISALIDTGRREEAVRMIDSRLANLPGGVVKSRYYYLRSRTCTDDDLLMSALRSSLFEDPRNLDALIAMFEYYHQRRDERRAVYYLKQALAIASDNPQLKRYEAEYASVLGSSY